MPVVEPVVTVALVGSAALLGVHVDPPEGWHVYWENPGDSGLATQVDVEVPEGWTAGPLAMPGPRRYRDGAGLVNYGWDEVVLLVPLDAPAGVSGTVRANVRWLACTADACVYGERSLTANWPPGTPVDLGSWSARVPTPVPENLVSRPSNGVDVKLPSVDVFPGPGAEAVAVERGADQTRLRWSTPPLPGARAVLAVGQDRFQFVELLPKPPPTPERP